METLDIITTAQPTLPDEDVVIFEGDNSKTYFQQSESEDELRADEGHEDGSKAGDVRVAEEQPAASNIPPSASPELKKESNSKKKKAKKNKDKDKNKNKNTTEENMNNDEQDKPVTISPPESKKKEKKGKKAKKDKKKAASNAVIAETELKAATAEVTTPEDAKVEETTLAEEEVPPTEALTEEAIVVDPKHDAVPISKQEGPVSDAAVEVETAPISTAEAVVPTGDKAPPAGDATLTEGLEPIEKGTPAEELPTEQNSMEEAPLEKPASENVPTEEMSTSQTSAIEERAEEAPIEEAPIAKPPIEEEPIKEASAEEAPTAEPPVKEEPIEEAPIKEESIKEAPAEEAPIAEPPIKEETIKEAPAEEAPMAERPVEEEPIKEAPIEEASIKEAPAEEAPTAEPPVKEEPIEEAPSDKEPTENPIAEELPTKQVPANESPEENPAEEASVVEPGTAEQESDEAAENVQGTDAKELANKEIGAEEPIVREIVEQTKPANVDKENPAESVSKGATEDAKHGAAEPAVKTIRPADIEENISPKASGSEAPVNEPSSCTIETEADTITYVAAESIKAPDEEVASTGKEHLAAAVAANEAEAKDLASKKIAADHTLAGQQDAGNPTTSCSTEGSLAEDKEAEDDTQQEQDASEGAKSIACPEKASPSGKTTATEEIAEHHASEQSAATEISIEDAIAEHTAAEPTAVWKLTTDIAEESKEPESESTLINEIPSGPAEVVDDREANACVETTQVAAVLADSVPQETASPLDKQVSEPTTETKDQHALEEQITEDVSKERTPAPEESVVELTEPAVEGKHRDAEKIEAITGGSMEIEEASEEVQNDVDTSEEGSSEVVGTDAKPAPSLDANAKELDVIESLEADKVDKNGTKEDVPEALKKESITSETATAEVAEASAIAEADEMKLVIQGQGSEEKLGVSAVDAVDKSVVEAVTEPEMLDNIVVEPEKASTGITSSEPRSAGLEADTTPVEMETAKKPFETNSDQTTMAPKQGIEDVTAITSELTVAELADEPQQDAAKQDTAAVMEMEATESSGDGMNDELTASPAPRMEFTSDEPDVGDLGAEHPAAVQLHEEFKEPAPAETNIEEHVAPSSKLADDSTEEPTTKEAGGKVPVAVSEGQPDEIAKAECLSVDDKLVEAEEHENLNKSEHEACTLEETCNDSRNNAIGDSTSEPTTLAVLAQDSEKDAPLEIEPSRVTITDLKAKHEEVLIIRMDESEDIEGSPADSEEKGEVLDDIENKAAGIESAEDAEGDRVTEGEPPAEPEVEASRDAAPTEDKADDAASEELAADHEAAPNTKTLERATNDDDKAATEVDREILTENGKVNLQENAPDQPTEPTIDDPKTVAPAGKAPAEAIGSRIEQAVAESGEQEISSQGPESGTPTAGKTKLDTETVAEAVSETQETEEIEPLLSVEKLTEAAGEPVSSVQSETSRSDAALVKEDGNATYQDQTQTLDEPGEVKTEVAETVHTELEVPTQESPTDDKEEPSLAPNADNQLELDPTVTEIDDHCAIAVEAHSDVLKAPAVVAPELDDVGEDAKQGEPTEVEKAVANVDEKHEAAGVIHSATNPEEEHKAPETATRIATIEAVDEHIREPELNQDDDKITGQEAAEKSEEGIKTPAATDGAADQVVVEQAGPQEAIESTKEPIAVDTSSQNEVKDHVRATNDSEGKLDSVQQAVETTPEERIATSLNEVSPTSDSTVVEFIERQPTPTENAAADQEVVSELSIEREAEAVVTAEVEPELPPELQAEVPAAIEAEPDAGQPESSENAIDRAKQASSKEAKEESAEDTLIAAAVGAAAIGSTLLVGAHVSKDKELADNTAPGAVRTTEDEESKDKLGPIPGEEKLANKSRKGEILHFVHDTPGDVVECVQGTSVTSIGVVTSGGSAKPYPHEEDIEAEAAEKPTDMSMMGILERPQIPDQVGESIESHTNEGHFESSEQLGSAMTSRYHRVYRREGACGISKEPKRHINQTGQIDQSQQADGTDPGNQSEVLEVLQRDNTLENMAIVSTNDAATLANDEDPVSHPMSTVAIKPHQTDTTAKKESHSVLRRLSATEDSISPAFTVVPDKPSLRHLQPETSRQTWTSNQVDVEEAVMCSNTESSILGTQSSTLFAEEASANNPLSCKDRSEIPEVTATLAQDTSTEEVSISCHQQEHTAENIYPPKLETTNIIATENGPLEEVQPSTQAEDLPIDHKSILTQNPLSPTESVEVEVLFQSTQPLKPLLEIECTPRNSDHSPISGERVDYNLRSDTASPTHLDSARSFGDDFIAVREETLLDDSRSNFGIAQKEWTQNLSSIEAAAIKQLEYESPYGVVEEGTTVFDALGETQRANDGQETKPTTADDLPQDDQSQSIIDYSDKSQETVASCIVEQLGATADGKVPNETLLPTPSACCDPFDESSSDVPNPQEGDVPAITQRGPGIEMQDVLALDVLAFSTSFNKGKIPSVNVKELTMVSTEDEQPPLIEVSGVQEPEKITEGDVLRKDVPTPLRELREASRDPGQGIESPQESRLAATPECKVQSAKGANLYHSTGDSAAADDNAADTQEKAQSRMIISACQSEEESSQNDCVIETALASAGIAAMTGAAFTALGPSHDSTSDDPAMSTVENNLFVKPAGNEELPNNSGSVRDNHESHPNSTSITISPVSTVEDQNQTMPDSTVLLPTTEFDPRATTPAVVIPDAEMIDSHRRKTLRRKQKLAIQDAEDTVAAAVVIYATAEALSPPASPKAGTFQHTDPAFSSLVESGRVVEEDECQSDADLYFSADETSKDPQRSGGDRDRERHHRRHRHSHHSHRSSRSHGEDETGTNEHRRHSHSSHGSHHRRQRSDSTGEDAPRTPPRRRDSGHSGEGSGGSGRRRRTPEEQAEHERRKAERLTRDSDYERRHRSDRYEHSERPEHRSFRSEHSERSERSERSAHRERRRDTYSPERSQHRSSRRHSHSSQHRPDRPERPERPERVSGPPVDKEVDSQQPQKRLFDVKHSEGIVGNGQIPTIAGETVVQDAEPIKASVMPKRSNTTRSRYSFNRTSTDQSRPIASKTRESVDATRGFISKNTTTPEDNARRARKSERSKKAVEEEKKPSGIKGMFKRLFG